jgi:hypothetical protein
VLALRGSYHERVKEEKDFANITSSIEINIINRYNVTR